MKEGKQSTENTSECSENILVTKNNNSGHAAHASPLPVVRRNYILSYVCPAAPNLSHPSCDNLLITRHGHDHFFASHLFPDNHRIITDSHRRSLMPLP